MHRVLTARNNIYSDFKLMYYIWYTVSIFLTIYCVTFALVFFYISLIKFENILLANEGFSSAE